MQGQCGEVTALTDARVAPPCSRRLESVTVISPPMWSLRGRSQLVASQGHQNQGTYLLWEHCANDYETSITKEQVEFTFPGA